MTEDRPMGALNESQKGLLHAKWARVPSRPAKGEMYWIVEKVDGRLMGFPASHLTFNSDYRWYFNNYFFAFACSIKIREKYDPKTKPLHHPV